MAVIGLQRLGLRHNAGCPFKSDTIICSSCQASVPRPEAQFKPVGNRVPGYRFWYENGYCQCFNDDLVTPIYFAVCPSCQKRDRFLVDEFHGRVEAELTNVLNAFHGFKGFKWR
jgi:hypothetical protein